MMSKRQPSCGIRRPVRVVLLWAIILIVTCCAACTGPAPGEPEQTIRIRYADQNDSDGWEAVKAAQPWLDCIEQSTAGRVKFEAFYSESLVKGSDAWDAARHDLTDLAWMFHCYWADKTTLANVISLPLLPFKSARQASGILWQLYQQYPSLRDQFNENQILVMWASSPYFLVTAHKPVKTLDDLKGLRLRVPAGPPADILKTLGAVPVEVGMPDINLYLQNGVIDGITTSWESLLSFKQYRLTKYYTYIPIFTVYFSQAMSRPTWDRLPSQVQAQIMSCSQLEGSLFWGENMFDSAARAGHDLVRSQSLEMVEYTIPDEELVRWQSAARPVWEDWVKAQTAAGYPEAREILDTTLNLINTYQP